VSQNHQSGAQKRKEIKQREENEKEGLYLVVDKII
jgi:hypothetical protein